MVGVSDGNSCTPHLDSFANHILPRHVELVTLVVLLPRGKLQYLARMALGTDDIRAILCRHLCRSVEVITLVSLFEGLEDDADLDL